MSQSAIIVDVRTQHLLVVKSGFVRRRYSISTAKKGAGNIEGSECTPLGAHHIAAMYGDGLDPYSVFVARKATGEIHHAELAKQYPNRDWILGRILHLSGTELNVNLGYTLTGACCDSFARYIYIHGTPDDQPMGKPLSHGCVRMRVTDVVDLYPQCSVGMQVFIVNTRKDYWRCRARLLVG